MGAKSKIFLLIILVLTACSYSEKDKNIVAKIGTHQITQQQFKERYSKFLFETGVSDNMLTRKSILNDMVNELLLYHYDDNQQIFDLPEYQKEVNWIKNQAVLGFLKDQEIFAKITANDSETRLAFQRVNMKVAARHLYTSTLDEANKLYDLLQIGVPFEELAKQVFTDSTLKNNGGYLGYFTWGDMDPAFEEAAFSTKAGEISKPVELEQGYSIIKVEDKVINPLLTEDEYLKKRARFEQVVKINKKRTSEREYIKRVLKSDDLVINKDVVQHLYSELYETNIVSNETLLSNDEVASKYKNTPYSVEMIKQRLEEIPVYHSKNIKDAKHLEIVIKGIILQDELMRIAEEKGYPENDRVTDAIDRLTINNFLKFKRIEIARNSHLAEETIKQYYDDHKTFFSTRDELNVKEIIVDDKNIATSLYNRIKAGEDFGSLAKEYSLRKTSADNNGELGMAPLSSYGLIADQLWFHKVGDLVAPIKINSKYGVFKIVDKNEAAIIEFDKVKKEVEIMAKFEKQKEMFQNYLEQLRTNYKIEIDEIMLGTTRINPTNNKSV